MTINIAIGVYKLKKGDSRHNLNDEEIGFLKELPKRIKKLRLENGMTQEKVAHKLSMTVRMYCKYELESVNLSVIVARRICHLYSISLDSLLGPAENHLK